MAPPDSSSTPNPALLKDTEAGLVALKQGDYPRAIALLETSTLPPQHPLSIKAKMGLVVAYTRNRDPQQAIALCQKLRQSDNPQVKEWADRTLENLAGRFPQFLEEGGAEDAETRGRGDAGRRDGEVGEDGEDRGDGEDKEGDIDLTGFVPFDGSLQQSSFVKHGEITEDTRSQEHIDVIGDTETQGRGDAIEDAETRRHGDAESRVVGSAEAGDLTGFVPLDAASLADQTTRTSSSPLSPLPSSPHPAGTLGTNTPHPTPLTSPAPHFPRWRQAERAKQWNPLGKVDISWLIAAQVGSAIALFFVLQQTVYLWQLFSGIALVSIPFLHLQRVIPEPRLWSILIPLLVLLFASRWILDGILTVGYGLQPLSLTTLSNYSPEAVKAINRYCRQRKVPLPTLGVVPTSAPMAFSYGVLPRFTRVVVSQGLLEQLADDEIAAIYASEVGHIAYRDVPLMSLLVVVNQIPYSLYRVVAEWGNRQTIPILRGLAIAVSAIAYGLYSLTRWAGLWLSRQRVYYSDHATADLTGNPNGLTRALLKIAIGTAKNVEQEGQTSYLLEGFEPLTPLGHRLATTLGSIYPYTPLEPVLEWEWSNPYRHWLALTNAHPPTGDRLRLLALYAHHWRLTPELEFRADLGGQSARRKPGLTAGQWRKILVQGAPFFGLGLGLGLAFALNLLGWVGGRMNLSAISWMYGDHAILRGFPLIGLSLGTFIRINPFFPDTKFSGFGKESFPRLTTLLQNPTAIPLDSTPVQLEGKLLGRPGISNILSQDILLKTETGIVPLHCLSPFGPIGNLLPRQPRFFDFLQQDLTATGWFRRGCAPWIDVDNLRTPGGRVDRSNHPLWSTLIGAIAAIWGILIIARGGIL